MSRVTPEMVEAGLRITLSSVGLPAGECLHATDVLEIVEAALSTLSAPPAPSDAEAVVAACIEIVRTEEELAGDPPPYVAAAMYYAGPVENARSAVRATKDSIIRRLNALRSPAPEPRRVAVLEAVETVQRALDGIDWRGQSSSAKNANQAKQKCGAAWVRIIAALRAPAPEARLEAAEREDDGRSAKLTERLKAIIDWCDLVRKNPQEFASHGVGLLEGPIFDAARAALSAH